MLLEYSKFNDKRNENLRISNKCKNKFESDIDQKRLVYIEIINEIDEIKRNNNLSQEINNFKKDIVLDSFRYGEMDPNEQEVEEKLLMRTEIMKKYSLRLQAIRQKHEL